MEYGKYDGKELMKNADLEDYMNDKFIFKFISASLMDIAGLILLFLVIDLQTTYILPLNLFDWLFYIIFRINDHYP